MPHIVLLGDSIFDNVNYVAGGPDVLHQVRDLLQDGWRASLNAVDGSVASDVKRQIGWLGSDVSHLVVSVGGNDALGQSQMLDQRVGSMAEAILCLADLRDQFEHDYLAMLDSVVGRGLPVAVCTIYNVRYPDSTRRRLANTALTIFNDMITRAAFSRNASLIDLRLICNDEEDFANPIEPSVKGGVKIAAAIEAFFLARQFQPRNSEVFARY